jgi:hypothetical protein
VRFQFQGEAITFVNPKDQHKFVQKINRNAGYQTTSGRYGKLVPLIQVKEKEGGNPHKSNFYVRGVNLKISL